MDALRKLAKKGQTLVQRIW